MNKDQLETKLQSLQFFKEGIDIKIFKGLMTNDSYLAYNDNSKYVVNEKQFDYFNSLRI